MRTSVLVWMNTTGAGDVVTRYVEDLRSARAAGLEAIWTPQLPYNPDVLTMLAFALGEVRDVVVAVGVVPIQTRHPITMAQQALIVSSISGGRLRLGIGLTHPFISDGMYGVPWTRNVRRLEEYLDALVPLLVDNQVDSDGDLVTAHVQLAMSPTASPPVYVAALGPQMLGVVGRKAAGTVTAMTGVRTLGSHVVPTLRAAAEAAARPGCEVVAQFPMCVTDDRSGAHAYLAERLAVYGAQPSYRAMLDREGAQGPADIALIGTEQELTGRVEELAAVGVDELAVDVHGRNDEERARTRAFLRTLV